MDEDAAPDAVDAADLAGGAAPGPEAERDLDAEIEDASSEPEEEEEDEEDEDEDEEEEDDSEDGDSEEGDEVPSVESAEASEDGGGEAS